MDEREWLAERFEEHRAHLRSVAYRMLGSLAEADDAVQDAWLRLSRSGAEGVDNLGAWLTTIVARVSLNMLRSRKLRREELVEYEWQESEAGPPRKYYKLTPKGRTQLSTLNDYWKDLNRTLAEFGN